eukprot:jgi/Ulvmu1/12793/UM097_0020.1
MLEEHTNFAAIYSLWQRQEVVCEFGPRLIATIKPLPSFLVTFIVMLGHRQMFSVLRAQGMGRYDMQEVRERLRKDLAACCALLKASVEYLTGATPCQADCFLWCTCAGSAAAGDVGPGSARLQHVAVLAAAAAVTAGAWCCSRVWW